MIIVCMHFWLMSSKRQRPCWEWTNLTVALYLQLKCSGYMSLKIGLSLPGHFDTLWVNSTEKIEQLLHSFPSVNNVLYHQHILKPGRTMSHTSPKSLTFWNQAGKCHTQVLNPSFWNWVLFVPMLLSHFFLLLRHLSALLHTVTLREKNPSEIWVAFARKACLTQLK